MYVVKYRYAVSRGQLTSINKVDESNRSFTYICPSCKQILRPRIGFKRARHFYHLNSITASKCSLESYLHYTAKHLLYEKLCSLHSANNAYWIHLRTKIDFHDETGNYLTSHLLDDKSQYNVLEDCSSIYLEKVFGGFKPDILIEYNNNKKPVFIEIFVTHKSPFEKTTNFRLIETKIANEDDFQRIIDKLEDGIDYFYNFDDLRTTIRKNTHKEQLLPSKKEVQPKKPGLTKAYKEIIINEIANDFKRKDLYAEMEFRGISISGRKRDQQTFKVLLSDFYTSIDILTEEEPHCVLHNIKNNRLFISFTHIQEKLSIEDRFIVLHDRSLNKPYLQEKNIRITNTSFDFSKVNNRDFVLQVNCFIPKGNYKSEIIEFSIEDYNKLIKSNEMEILRIESIKRV
jgi:hypothetical protein